MGWMPKFEDVTQSLREGAKALRGLTRAILGQHPKRVEPTQAPLPALPHPHLGLQQAIQRAVQSPLGLGQRVSFTEDGTAQASEFTDRLNLNLIEVDLRNSAIERECPVDSLGIMGATDEHLRSETSGVSRRLMSPEEVQDRIAASEAYRSTLAEEVAELEDMVRRRAEHQAAETLTSMVSNMNSPALAAYLRERGERAVRDLRERPYRLDPMWVTTHFPVLAAEPPVPDLESS